MAITYTQRAAASSTTDASSYSTVSFTPTANRLVIASVIAFDSAAITEPSCSGNSITWTSITSQTAAHGSGTNVWIQAWYGWNAAPTTGAVTFTFGATMTGAMHWVFELTNARLEAPVRSNVGALSVDVGTSLATSALMGSFARIATASVGTFTPGTGYTEVLDALPYTQSRGCFIYDMTAATDGIVDCTNSGGTTPTNAGAAWECLETTPTRVPVNLAASHYMGR